MRTNHKNGGGALHPPPKKIHAERRTEESDYG